MEVIILNKIFEGRDYSEVQNTHIKRLHLILQFLFNPSLKGWIWRFSPLREVFIHQKEVQKIRFYIILRKVSWLCLLLFEGWEPPKLILDAYLDTFKSSSLLRMVTGRKSPEMSNSNILSQGRKVSVIPLSTGQIKTVQSQYTKTGYKQKRDPDLCCLRDTILENQGIISYGLVQYTLLQTADSKTSLQYDVFITLIVKLI